MFGDQTLSVTAQPIMPQQSDMIRHHGIASLTLAALVVAGCTSTTPPVRTVPTTKAPPPPSPETASSLSWSPRYTTGQWHYAMNTRATVTVLSDSSAPPSNIGSHTTLTVSVTREGPESLQFRIVVDSFTVTRPSTIDTTPPKISPHPQLEQTVTTHGAPIAGTTTLPPPENSCDTVTLPLPSAIRQIITTLPATLTPGTSWRDTTAVQTCRGTTLLEETRTTLYRVTGLTRLRGTSTIQLERSAMISLRTPAADATLRLMVDGHGESHGIMYIDPVDAMPTASNDHTTLTLTVGVGRSTVIFRQDGTQEITRQ